ncbi:hypothetical protein [Sporosarcina limicola]|uniref:Uncharacterized protein n=1 Tax=Sporosarcina limicola TaxID=34101 RepID=A0A927MIW5_9BACL|nr:hypothetical protein [Sporosarcina limicola]MBE1553812.1 hypothetical protein [Sporosarcina limicola]
MVIYYGLTDKFNNKLQQLDPEFEDGKEGSRPFIYLSMIVDDINILLPLRTNAKHKHVFHVKEGRVGFIDYSKAIVIDYTSLDSMVYPFPKNIHQKSHIYIQNNLEKIRKEFQKYVKIYKDAWKTQHHNPGSKHIVDYSTLKNYHAELNIHT